MLFISHRNEGLVSYCIFPLSEALPIFGFLGSKLDFFSVLSISIVLHYKKPIIFLKLSLRDGLGEMIVG